MSKQHAEASQAIERARQALEGFKKGAGRPEDQRAVLQAEVHLSLIEAQIARVATLTDMLGDAERNLIEAAGGLGQSLGNAIDELRKANEQGTVHAETLARWTRYMVLAIVFQGGVLAVQLLIAL